MCKLLFYTRLNNNGLECKVLERNTVIHDIYFREELYLSGSEKELCVYEVFATYSYQCVKIPNCTNIFAKS